MNKLLAWLQAHPKKLIYRRFGGSGGKNPEAARRTHVRLVSDAAFKREGEEGHCLRGAMFLRAPGQNDTEFVCSCVVHILDYICKGQRHVARSTFAAELLSAGDATDQGLLVPQQLHEMLSGPVDATEARELRLTGGFAVPMVLIVDAMSVFAAVIATFMNKFRPKSHFCVMCSSLGNFWIGKCFTCLLGSTPVT